MIVKHVCNLGCVIATWIKYDYNYSLHVIATDISVCLQKKLIFLTGSKHSLVCRTKKGIMRCMFAKMVGV
jgi:NRPS condensation-like uncharacterized protein